jgi:hypothetical protein
MTNPKTDHKIRKPTETRHSSASRAAAPTPERQTSASATMTEACDRLGQKLDEVTGLIREQLDSWRPIRPPAAPPPTATPAAGTVTEPNGPPAQGEIQADQGAGASAQESPSGETAPAPPAGTSEAGRLAARALEASRLVDTLARSRAGWQEHAAGMQQALEAVTAYLESQAATAAPKLEVEAIMSRLKDLEERQQALQTQFNTNR